MKKLQPLRVTLYEYPSESLRCKPRNSNSPSMRTTRSSFKKIPVPPIQKTESSHKIFNAFNYQNYQRPRLSKQLSPRHRNVLPLRKENERYELGVNKNIELIYCRNKIDDFEEILSNRVQTNILSQTRQSKSTQLIRSKTSHKTLQQTAPTMTAVAVGSCNKPYRITRGKSSLISLMKEFSQLHKQSVRMNPEKGQTFIRPSILIRKYPFLQSLDNRVLSNLFKSLGPDEKDGLFEVQLQTFILFSKLFTIRDANISEMAEFLGKFLFQEDKEQISSAKDIFQRLQGSAAAHKKAWSHLQGFFTSGLEFKDWAVKNSKVCVLIIDIIVLSK